MNTELKQAIKRAKLALEGDSNDEEHDALFELVEALEPAPRSTGKISKTTRAQMLDDLRHTDTRAKEIRKILGISGIGEEIFQYEVGDIDEDLIVVANGYGGASLQHVDGDGDNRIIKDSREFDTEAEACVIAGQVMDGDIELDEAFPQVASTQK